MDVVEEKDRRIATLQEASNLLGRLSRSKIYDLIDEGKLRRVKLGGRTFVTRASLDNYLDAAFAEGERITAEKATGAG
jgi:excisionase family DNA binding protein